ncbi:MAG: sulfatase [Planctomycetota bacterium]
MPEPERRRAVVVMFDSLNRHFLSPYGAAWTRTPNFARLARRARTYDRSYVCSMPCMPARRDMHTGRPSFMRRGWGPLEPWDDSIFTRLRDDAGVYSHLSTDHYHYFETGGANYHARYDSWEFFRGQEGDPWIGQVGEVDTPDHVNGKLQRQDWVNRPYTAHDEDHYQTHTFNSGLDFIDRNADEDKWVLHIECFDPHEPFTCDPLWKSLFPDPDNERGDPIFDWPNYGRAPEGKLVEKARRNYAALLAKCDASLGRVLDAFDEHDLWDDTMLIVCTDHGLLLGEHDWMMKNTPPLYEEVSHTPLFVHDPRHSDRGGTRTGKLVQPAIDLAPTLAGFFGCAPPKHATGLDLCDDEATRDAVLFGYFNARANLVTERHAYYRGGREDVKCPAYTMMPMTMREPFPLEQLRGATLAEPLADSEGIRPLATGPTGSRPEQSSSLLFDLADDPAQDRPLDNADLESELADRMKAMMADIDAPPEQFERLGFA